MYHPRDRDTAFIQRGDSKSPYNSLQYTQFYPAPASKDYPHPHHADKNAGHLFHAHCWKFFIFLLGEQVTDETIGNVVQAAKQYWKPGIPRFERSPYRPWDIGDDDVRFWAHQEDGVEYAKYEKYVYGCDIYRSPWVVPEVQESIRTARSHRQNGKQKSSYFDTRIPPEILLMMMEIICPLEYTQENVQDMRNLLSVFSWDIPKSFWERRLKLDIHMLPELDLLEKVDLESLDWQLLGLSLMDLRSDPFWPSSGLANRQRVQPFIEEIIANFRELTKS